MGLIKDVYSLSFYKSFSSVLEKTLPGFDTKQFTRRIYADDFENKEWKERMKHTTAVLHHFMPQQFPAAAKHLIAIITELRNRKEDNTFPYIFFADYIETHGINDVKASIKALEFTTQFISCEFAVRPFILRYPDTMIPQMIKWSAHSSYKVRRLASEGSRPRLPWAMALPALKKDPTAILILLENLKNDPHEWVRKSVANNLNDIAKDNPHIVLRIAQQWKGTSKETDAIVKHGLRTLFKQGHTEVLKLYGLNNDELSFSKFKVLTSSVSIGDHIHFSFRVANNGNTIRQVRFEYAVYYKKANGSLNKKVFKISERLLAPGETIDFNRKHSFKLITTRTFYTGVHEVAAIINGEEKNKLKFTLLD